VAVASCEVLRTSAVQIARDRQRLEKNLGHDDGAAEIEHDAAVVEIGQRARKPLEVAMTRCPERGAVGARMLVDDFGTDRRVYGDRHVELRAREQYGDV